jgi:hypothetical protein
MTLGHESMTMISLIKEYNVYFINPIHGAPDHEFITVCQQQPANAQVGG